MNLITKSMTEINTIIANKRPFGYKPSPHTGENTCVNSIPKNINTNAFSVKAIVVHVLWDKLDNSASNTEIFLKPEAWRIPAATAAMIPDTSNASANT